MTAFECISCSFFICIYKFFFFSLPEDWLAVLVPVLKHLSFISWTKKDVHSAKLGCYLKRLFFLDSFQLFYLSPVAVKKCLGLLISLRSDLVTCICLYLLPWHLYICVATYPLDTSLVPFHGVCGFPVYYVHKTIIFTFTCFCIVWD